MEEEDEYPMTPTEAPPETWLWCLHCSERTNARRHAAGLPGRPCGCMRIRAATAACLWTRASMGTVKLTIRPKIRPTFAPILPNQGGGPPI